MSLNTPTYRSLRPVPRTIPNSWPDTRVPRPRSFPANTNRPPPRPSPEPVRFRIRNPRRVIPAVINALWSQYQPIQVNPVTAPVGTKAGGWTVTHTADLAFSSTVVQTLVVGPSISSAVANRSSGVRRNHATLAAAVTEYNSFNTPYAPGHTQVITPIGVYAQHNIPSWTPWTFPYVMYGGVVWKWPGGASTYPAPSFWYLPEFQPVPRNYPKEEPVPSLRTPSPRIRPGIGFDVRPDAPPRPVYVPATRPPRGTREGKTVGAAATAVAMVADALDTATEVADVLAIFWDHIAKVTPGNDRTFYQSMKEMMESPDLWAQVDWSGMVQDMIMNEIEDQVVGRLHGLKRRLQSEWGTPTYGGAFKGP